MTKILVIEDQEDIREIVCEILMAEDFEVIDAENGEVGVNLARTEVPDLIICDIMMPKLDGYGVLQELRKNPSTNTVPFIFLTAKASKSDLRQGMQLGADDYLSKPFSREELLGAITARQKKQKEIKKQSQQELDELRGNLIRSLPHELHTPLNGILGFSQILIEDYDITSRDDSLQMLKDIHSSGERLYRTTQNFLLYAELELLEKDPQSQGQLIRKEEIVAYTEKMIAQLCLEQAGKEERKTDLILELEPFTVNISEGQLTKIIEEVLDNAFKFSSPGTSVSVQTSSQQETVKISIRNSGIGMTSEQIAKLGAYMQFERKIHEQQGSGLGLILAKRLTELNQGKLIIESVPNRETNVQITLPTKPEPNVKKRVDL
ncbi:MAG: response regulator [Spirulinaceae cyanobacterium]